MRLARAFILLVAVVTPLGAQVEPAARDFVATQVSGVVTDVAGKPMAGVTVQVGGASGSFIEGNLNPAPRSETNAEGRYALTVRSERDKTVHLAIIAERAGYLRTMPPRLPVRGGGSGRLDLVMREGLVLAGVVLPRNRAELPAGEKMEQAARVLQIGTESDAYTESTITAPDGSFEIYLPPGEHTVRALIGLEWVEWKGVKAGQRDVVLEPPAFWIEAEVGKAFDQLWQKMDLEYSYFFIKKDVDWAALKAKHRPEAVAARDAKELGEVLQRMLTPLGDIHVRVQTPHGMLPTTKGDWTYNGNLKMLEVELGDIVRCGRFAVVGRTKTDGFGYFLMVRQNEANPEDGKKAVEAIGALRDAPGFVVDLRRANGGSEPLAQEVARLFCAKDTVYALHKYRNGPGHENFGPVSRRILPASEDPYTKPVVCLIGPGAVSSGEGFAKMMDCLPNVKLVGLPTRGASGNPAPWAVGRSGVRVWYSRWVDMLPDGRLTEGVGVPPDVRVDVPVAAYEKADPTLEKGLEVLREAVKSSAPAGK